MCQTVHRQIDIGHESSNLHSNEQAFPSIDWLIATTLC